MARLDRAAGASCTRADPAMILVTGGAGFIGANFVLDWLAGDGEAVVNLDKLTYAGNLGNLDALRGELLEADRRGKPSRARPDDNDIELHRLPGRSLSVGERHGHVPELIPCGSIGRARPARQARPRRALLQFSDSWHRLPP